MDNICYKTTADEVSSVARRNLLDRIAIGVAHEIRNPLTVVKGYLQLQAKKSGDGNESLEIVFQELLRIENLVSNIVALAHSKVSKKNPEDLSGILKKVYPVIQNAALKNGIVTELKLADNLPLLDLHAGEVEELILQLASNGIEAMTASGKLTLGIERKPGSVILYVKDKGCGIPAGQIKQIFDPFFTTKAGNTGLGLAMGLSIVERHQGRIEVISALGKGSTFKILFPVAQKG